jgi:hypothetical protein
MKRPPLIVLIFVVSAVGYCALARTPIEEFKTSKGKPVVIANLIARKNDCSIATTGVPTFAEPAKHGTLEMQAMMMDLPAAGPCPAQNAPIISLVYVPHSNFVGSDNVKIEIANHNQLVKLHYHIIISNEAD